MIRKRKIFSKLLAEAEKAKVSIILGARQVGKTTALQYLQGELCTARKHKGIFLDLDIYSNFEKISTYENAVNTFKLAGYQPGNREMFYVFLDEFQRYKDITMIIKNIFDHHKNIKVYLTGSSSLAIKQKVQESLAGRKIITHLYPLDFEEALIFRSDRQILSQYNNVQRLRGDDLAASTKEIFSVLEEFIVFGAYPEVVLADSRQEKIEILKSIFDLYMKKELVEYLKIEKIQEAKKLIQYLAVNNAQKIKYQAIAQFAGFSQKTAKNYIELLKETFLIAEVRPFFTNKNKELVKIPKVYFIDSGVANFFINNFNGFSLRKDASFLLETYVLSELIKSGVPQETIKFWQDKNQTEVDFVIERNEELIAFEVKHKRGINPGDYSSLKVFKEEYNRAQGFLVNISRQKASTQFKAILPYRIRI